jgi:CBS domain-containing protein
MPRLERPIAEFIVHRPLPAVSTHDDVARATVVMKEQRADCVVVLEGESLAGIFTERDFLNRVAAAGLDPAVTRMKQVMTPHPDTLSPTDSIAYAVNKMAMGEYRNIPIVENKKVLSVLTVRDVMGHLFDVFAEAHSRDSTEVRPWRDVGGG